MRKRKKKIKRKKKNTKCNFGNATKHGAVL
jgi:hypothetical protein